MKFKLNDKCRECQEGTYQEFHIMSDSWGEYQCTNCGDIISTEVDYEGYVCMECGSFSFGENHCKFCGAGSEEIIHPLNSHPEYLFVRRAIENAAMEAALKSNEDTKVYLNIDFVRRVYHIFEDMDEVNGELPFTVVPARAKYDEDYLYEQVINTINYYILIGQIEGI